MKQKNLLPTFEEMALSRIKSKLESLKDRAKDASNQFDKGKYELMLAELFYLRGYLDSVDNEIRQLGKDKIKSMSKRGNVSK